MKTKNCMLTLLIAFFLGFSCFAQEVIEKNYFDSNSKLGSDVIIKKSTIKVEGPKSYKIFEIESPTDGNYYMNAWASGVELEKFGSGKFVEYELVVNDEKQIEKFRPAKSNWQNAEFNDSKTKEKKTVKLKKGLNQIIFSCYTPLIPDIDFITLSLDKTKTEISDTKYNEFVEKIKRDMVGRLSNPIDITDSLHKLKNGIVLLNPEGNFNHHLEATFMYTYYTTASFTSGQQIFIATNANNFQHVLELFSASDPQNASWTVISNSNSLANINVTIPITGLYYIKVRSWTQSQQGLVNINVNGQYYYTNCTASGYSGFRHSVSPGTYNYYTCKISGDTRIWLEDNIGFPGRIVAYNDDYYGSGDFSWGLASRINKNFSINIEGMQFSSYSSSTPTGTCDYYIDVNPLSTETYYTGIWPFRTKHTRTPILDAFPNLKADDAMQSALQTNTYNCGSWAGGITDGWFWGCKSPDNTSYCNALFYGDPYAWNTWDNYFGNSPPRYAYATTYTKEGATASNSAIAVWSLNGAISGVTHFSVFKPANNNPHGYDWESKPGGMERIFHPKNALISDDYGNILSYYKVSSLKSTALNSSSSKVLTFNESVALGLTVIENVSLNSTEKSTLESAKMSNDNIELESLFDSWIKTLYNPDLISNSNPYLFFENNEFYVLFEYCIQNENKSIVFFADKLFGTELSKFESEITSLFFCGFAAKNHKGLLDEVKNIKNLKSSYTQDGAYIAPIAINTTKKFIKKILFNEESLSNTSESKAIENKYNSYEYFNIYPNPVKGYAYVNLKIDKNEVINISLFDLKGSKIKDFTTNQLLGEGSHELVLDVQNLSSGIYICKILVGDKPACRKIYID